MSEKILCPKCDNQVIWNFAITRRPCGYEENSKICDDCAKREAFVDMSDDITKTGLLHHEYSYFQLSCGNAEKSGDQRFQEFLDFRKRVGKHDPTPKEIDSIILKKMCEQFS